MPQPSPCTPGIGTPSQEEPMPQTSNSRSSVPVQAEPDRDEHRAPATQADQPSKKKARIGPQDLLGAAFEDRLDFDEQLQGVKEVRFIQRLPDSDVDAQHVYQYSARCTRCSQDNAKPSASDARRSAAESLHRELRCGCSPCLPARCSYQTNVSVAQSFEEKIIHAMTDRVSDKFSLKFT